MTALRRLLALCLAVAATLLVVAVGAYLSAPLWIDSSAVKNEIARLVERATGQPVRIEQLQVRLFPPVGVEVSNPRFESRALSAQAGSAVIDLRFLPLLVGRVQPRLVRISGARVAVAFEPTQPARPLTLQDVDRQLRDGLARLAGSAPGLDLEIDQATVELTPAGKSPIVLRSLNARARVSEAGVAATVECASGFWQRALLDFSLARDLSGRGRAEFVGLDIAAAQAWTALQGEWSIDPAEVIGHAEWRMKGLSQVDVSFAASSSLIGLRRGPSTQALSGLVAAGTASLQGNAWSLDLDRLYLREPRLMLSGRLARDAQGRFAFRAGGGDLDLVQLLAIARNMAPESPSLQKPPVILHAGTVASIDLASEAESLPGLFDVTALHGELQVREVDAALRSPSLRFSGAGAAVALDRGTVRVRAVRASVGNTHLRDGQVDADLADEPRLLRAMALVDFDLAETLAIAGRLLNRGDVRRHLDEIEHVEGRALARIEVTEGRRGLQAAVDLSDLALTVRHRQVPLPLRLTGGRLRYAAGTLALEQAGGAFGRSPFSGVDANLHLQSPFRFQVQRGEARLSLEELFLVMRKMPAMAPVAAEIQGLTGNLALRDLQADGTIEAIAATRFSLRAHPHAVKALVVRLDTDVLADGGEAQVTDRQIVLRDVDVETLDTRLRVSGRTTDYRAGLRTLEAAASGEVGAATLQRVQKEAALPAAVSLRPPLQISGINAAWKREGETTLKGRVRVAGSTDVDIDAAFSGQTMRIRALRIKDQATDATLVAERREENVNAAFRGKLAGETIAAMFLQPPFTMQAIEGDIAADIHLERPWITRVQGRLAGSAIAVPLEPEALAIEHVVLAGTGTGITVEQAAGALGENRAEIKGTVHRVDSKLILDADVRADRLPLAKLMERPAAAEGDRPFALSDLPVAGRLGLDIGRVEIPKGEIAPLVAEARVDGDLLDLRIERAAICDINLSGTLRGRLADMQLDGSLASRQADVEKSIACLTGGRVVLTGKMDLDARLSASGPLGGLVRHLDGNFTARATEGRIERFDTLNRVFAFLNVTEVARGQNLHMGEKGLAYRTVDAKGRLAGEVVHLDEIVMDAPTVHIAAAGSIDYSDGKLGMDVLVAPLQTANVLIEKIPLMDRIFGSSVLALPVRVSGTVQAPIVVPLGPGAVARRMTSIIANTLRLPIDAVKTVTPTSNAPQ